MKAKPDRRVRDAERALEREPDSLVLRLRLAAALRAAGRPHDAVDLYRSVARSYQREGRLLQALAVCRSVLEILPDDLETHVLHAEIEVARTGDAQAGEPTRHDDGSRRLPLPEVAVGPEEYDFDEDTERTGKR